MLPTQLVDHSDRSRKYRCYSKQEIYIIFFHQLLDAANGFATRRRRQPPGSVGWLGVSTASWLPLSQLFLLPAGLED